LAAWKGRKWTDLCREFSDTIKKGLGAGLAEFFVTVKKGDLRSSWR